MDLILETLLWAKKHYHSQIKAMEKELEKLPKGRLYRRERNHRFYYSYWHDGKQDFIQKENSALLQGLATIYSILILNYIALSMEKKYSMSTSVEWMTIITA